MKNVSISSFTFGNISPVNEFAIQTLVDSDVVTFVKRIETHNTSRITDKNGTHAAPLARRTNAVLNVAPAGAVVVAPVAASSSFVFIISSQSVDFIVSFLILVL